MDVFKKQVALRWSDLDPNFHMRHSVYYDLCAQQRVEILQETGLTLQVFKEQHFGPILFREECVFKREIRLADEVYLTTRLARMLPDASRWTIEHEFLSASGKLMAKITVEGAWIDTNLRKLASPVPQIVIDVFSKFPRTDTFEIK